MVKIKTLKDIPSVKITHSGKFKYVLLELMDSNGENKTIVREDIVDKVALEIEGSDISIEVLGGGTIQHDPDKDKIFIYGYSMTFGQANHEKTVELLKNCFLNYKSITFSNEGYF